MKRALIIFQGRELGFCLKSLRKLDIPKIWVIGHYPIEYAHVVAKIIESSNYDYYSILGGDDCLVTPEALEVTFQGAEKHGIFTAWCNIGKPPNIKKANSNVVLEPLKSELPIYKPKKYELVGDVMKMEGDFRTYFTGMALMTMPREMWLKYPVQVYHQLVKTTSIRPPRKGDPLSDTAHKANIPGLKVVRRSTGELVNATSPGPKQLNVGFAADWRLSWRLQEDGVEIRTNAKAFIEHHRLYKNFILKNGRRVEWDL